MLSALGLSFWTVVAQQHPEKEYLRKTPGLITIDQSTDVSTKSTQDLFSKYLNLSQNNTLNAIGQHTDKLGFVHEKFQQTYKGIKVEFGNVTLHSRNGKASSLSTESYDIKEMSVTPSITREKAFQNALDQIGASSYLWDNPSASRAIAYQQPTGELVLLPMFDHNDNVEVKLAYKFDIYATQPLSRGDVYIDAHTGNPLFYNATIKHLDEYSNSSKNLVEVPHHNEATSYEDFSLATGNAATRYSGNREITTRQIGSSYALRDNTRGNGVNTYNSNRSTSYPTTNITDNDNNWTSAEFDNSNKDNAALDAHWGAAQTYDYFKSEHDRDSFDGNNAAINSWVHYGQAFDNAFWNGSVMTYGDGSSNGNEGNGIFDALTSIDVAAHEIGHAVTTNTANLAYRRESGALNEGFSDIWGAAVEHFSKGNGSDTNPDLSVWLIGDEIDRRSGSAALRSMSDPKSLGYPDTYHGDNWKAATVAEGCITPIRGPEPQGNDYCGVHTNSGVLNHWFFILTTGASGTNDVGDVYDVTAIGMTKAAKISYRTLSVYLSANSTFADARAGAIQATRDLYGTGGTEEIAVTNAWYAVNVGDAYNGGGTGSTCTTTVATFPYNEGFENTLGAWSQGTGDDIDWDINSGGTNSNNTGPSSATQGTYYIYIETSGNGTGYPNKSAVLNSPCFDLSGHNQATFNFKYHMYGGSTGTLVLEASTDGSTWNQVWNLNGDQGNSWESASVNLNSYTGDTVRLRFTATSSTSYTSDIALDDLSLVTTGGNTNPDPTGYCASNGDNVSDEYIQRVQLGSIDNTSNASNGGYADYTTQSTTLNATNNTITITPAWTGRVYSEGYAVWIDFNRDGDFEDANELVFSQSPTQANTVSGSFDVPATAQSGATRMRVSMRYNETPATCGSFDYGEVEDYNVTITNTAVDTSFTTENTLSTSSTFKMYPNPVSGNKINVILPTTGVASYSITTLLGQVVKHELLKNNQIDVSNLNSGMYLLQVKTDNQLFSKRFIKD